MFTQQLITIPGGKTYYCDKHVSPGAQGGIEVYKAYPVDEKTQEVIREKEINTSQGIQKISTAVALKIIPRLEYFNANSYFLKIKQPHLEGVIAKHVYPKTQVFTPDRKQCQEAKIPHQVYMETDYIDAGKFGDDEVSKLSFSQRINLITKIALWLSYLHHESPSTGPAIVHSDIISRNFLFQYVNGGIEVYPIDFGFSFVMEADNPDAIADHPKETRGNPVYYPLETLNYKAGIKTDIYMSVSVIAIILGEKNPFRLKGKVLGGDANQPYPLDQLVPFPSCGLPWVDLKDLTIRFLNRMQDKEYKKRPDTNEVLRFFTTMSQLDKLRQLKSTEETTTLKKIYTAKLILLATGKWYEKVEASPKVARFHNSIGLELKVDMTRKELEKNTYEQFDFEGHEAISLAIYEQYYCCNNFLKNSDWNALSYYLMNTNKIINPQLINEINKNRKEIVAASIAQLKKMEKSKREKIIDDMQKGRNALGQILHTPTKTGLLSFFGSSDDVENIVKIFKSGVDVYQGRHWHRF